MLARHRNRNCSDRLHARSSFLRRAASRYFALECVFIFAVRSAVLAAEFICVVPIKTYSHKSIFESIASTRFLTIAAPRARGLQLGGERVGERDVAEGG